MGSRMATALVGLVLCSLASLGGAGAACTELGCANAFDTDGDGAPDRVVVASGTEHTAVNAWADEAGADARIELVGDEHQETFPVLAVDAWVEGEGHDGHRALHAIGARGELVMLDHETARADTVVLLEAELHDTDGDHLPEDPRVLALVP